MVMVMMIIQGLCMADVGRETVYVCVCEKVTHKLYAGACVEKTERGERRGEMRGL